MRFQQLTGPLMAKGFEDTTLYIYNRFISLNEVGGKPEKFGISKNEFNNFLCNRNRQWPHSLNATSTHDTKRGEDVRARLNVLSELPGDFEEKVKYWNKINRRFKTNINGTNSPDKNDEFFLYQTMIGTYPFYNEEHAGFTNRLKEYINKAAREAKVYTSWERPNINYENAFTTYVEKILDLNISEEFLKDFLAFQRKIAFYGALNSLSQVLIKLTAPGVPDIYQGAEMWDLSMVDPDNRRPVDFSLRKKILAEIKTSTHNLSDYLNSLIRNYQDARIKVYIVTKTLELRKKLIELFNKGSFEPIDSTGLRKNNVIAFGRRNGTSQIVVITPRFCTQFIKEEEALSGDWGDTTISLISGAKKWENIFTKETIINSDTTSVGEVLKHFPVALLYSTA